MSPMMLQAAGALRAPAVSLKRSAARFIAASVHTERKRANLIGKAIQKRRFDRVRRGSKQS